MSLIINSFEEIEQSLSNNKKKLRAVFVAPSDLKTLEAVLLATKKNLIEPIFIGDEELIIKKSNENNLDISEIEILNFSEPYKALETASKLASIGEVDLIIKGKYQLSDFIEKLFHNNSEFCELQNVHHVAFCRSKEYHKYIFLTDSFVHCQPDLKTKTKFINSSVTLANKLGVSRPKVAILAAVEVVYKQMPVTVEADEIQKLYSNNKSCIVEGPISFDIAIDKQAAIAKGLINSEVAGEVDIMVAPNIGTANGIYKALSLFSKVEIAGIIIGGKVPVVAPAKVDSVQTRYNSILLSLIACSETL